MLLGSGCDMPVRSQPDATASSSCGDGVVNGESGVESCDDGGANGNATSLCSIQCADRTVRWHSMIPPTTVLPFPARKLVDSGPALVISSFDDSGIATVPIGNDRPTDVLRKYSAPTAFQVGGWTPSPWPAVMWIERAVPGQGGPWLLWAKIGEPFFPVIHEVTYTTPNSTGGVFIRSGDFGNNAIVEVIAGRLLYRLPIWELLAPDGSIDIWAAGAAADDNVATLFGRLPLGTEQIRNEIHARNILAATHDGALIVLMGNQDVVAGRSLRSQSLPIGAPCSVCTIADASTIPEWVAFDLLAVHGYVEPARLP